MTPQFQVRVLEFTVLAAIPGARSGQNVGDLLDLLEFGDRSGLDDAEQLEMCLMSLQDLGAAAAAARVLTHDLGDVLTSGQIQNLSHDMLTEKFWEEHPEMELHERFFTAGSLLHAAFPGEFPEPDAVRVDLEITAGNSAAGEVLAEPLHESLLVRLLANGMDDNSVLRRLFDEQLTGTSFPEADTIVWIVDRQIVDARTQRVQVTSSGRWLDPLRNTESFPSSAYAD